MKLFGFLIFYHYIYIKIKVIITTYISIGILFMFAVEVFSSELNNETFTWFERIIGIFIWPIIIILAIKNFKL